MDYKTDPIYDAPNFKLIQKKSIDTIEIYLKFINWVSGEFDLNLQDESSLFIIYYPNGYISINCNLEGENKIIVEFTVISKSRKSCHSIFIQLESIFNHVHQLYGCNKSITYELQ